MQEPDYLDYDEIITYVNEALRDLEWAKREETGSSFERANLENARRALENASVVLGRGLLKR